jgi:nicotinamide mononucleotide (NMN) deamidase PncC
MKVSEFVSKVAETRAQRRTLGIVVTVSATLMAWTVVSMSGVGGPGGALVSAVTGVVFLSLVWVVFRIPAVQRFALTGSWAKDRQP